MVLNIPHSLVSTRINRARQFFGAQTAIEGYICLWGEYDDHIGEIFEPPGYGNNPLQLDPEGRSTLEVMNGRDQANSLGYMGGEAMSYGKCDWAWLNDAGTRQDEN